MENISFPIKQANLELLNICNAQQPHSQKSQVAKPLKEWQPAVQMAMHPKWH